MLPTGNLRLKTLPVAYQQDKFLVTLVFYYGTQYIYGHPRNEGRGQQMVQLCTADLVINILEKKVGVPADTPGIATAPWEDLGVDSLGLSEVFASLWHSLGVEIPHEEALHTANIQELVLLVNAQF
jgi:acyl carrier protein